MTIRVFTKIHVRWPWMEQRVESATLLGNLISSRIMLSSCFFLAYHLANKPEFLSCIPLHLIMWEKLITSICWTPTVYSVWVRCYRIQKCALVLLCLLRNSLKTSWGFTRLKNMHNWISTRLYSLKCLYQSFPTLLRSKILF